MKRLPQTLLILTFLLLSWLLMQVIHECGHIIAALLSGGVVEQVVLHPLAISRTDFATNPHPLWVAWWGALFGSILPLLCCAFTRKFLQSYHALFVAFAGFCLMANGIYLGVGVFEAYGDAGDIVRHGGEKWQLLLFGVLTVPSGLYLWDRVSLSFGFGEEHGHTERKHFIACAALLLLVLVGELL